MMENIFYLGVELNGSSAISYIKYAAFLNIFFPARCNKAVLFAVVFVLRALDIEFIILFCYFLNFYFIYFYCIVLEFIILDPLAYYLFTDNLKNQPHFCPVS